MKRFFAFCVSFAALMFVAIPAHGTYNATVTGTVAYVQQISTTLQYTAETTSFALSNQPTVPGAQYQQFVISPATVPDAQTRKNMVAIVLTAKATGAQLQVAYDNTGGYLDQGLVGVYYVVLR